MLEGDKRAQLEVARETFEALCEEDFQCIRSPIERVGSREFSVLMQSYNRHRI